MRIVVPQDVRGFTLVELVLFIVIVAVVAAAMFQAFMATMRGSHYGKELTQATQLAQQRMEIIMGERKRLGFAGITAATYDPCPPVGAWANQACPTTSYTVTSTYNNPLPSCDPNCKEVTVTVTGPYGDVLTRLTFQMWNY